MTDRLTLNATTDRSLCVSVFNLFFSNRMSFVINVFFTFVQFLEPDYRPHRFMQPIFVFLRYLYFHSTLIAFLVMFFLDYYSLNGCMFHVFHELTTLMMSSSHFAVFPKLTFSSSLRYKMIEVKYIINYDNKRNFIKISFVICVGRLLFFDSGIVASSSISCLVFYRV